MPIYEYRCDACGHALEAIQKLSDAPLADCPACGKSTLKKLISAAGFQLKGSGWYQTDFKGGTKKPETANTDSTADASAKKPQGCGGGSCGGCAHG
jgi:putative FmdB family regulatory protein